MLSDEPDLTAELDAAEDIVTGRAEAIVTEWGVRLGDGREIGCANEYLARLNAAGKNGDGRLRGTVIRRTVTYSPWETVNDSAPAAAMGEDDTP